MRPIFLRPVEVGAGPHVTITCAGGGGASNVSITAGVYSSVEAVALALLNAVNAELDGSWATGDITMEIQDDATIAWHNVGVAGVILWVWADTDLRDELGFVNDFSFTAVITTVEATYTPKSVWLPPYQHSDQGMWYVPQADLFSGATSQDGALCGTSGNPSIWFRDYQFPHVPVESLLRSAATSQNKYDRCLETFSEQVRTAVPSDPSYPRMAAVWCVFDYNDLVGTYTTATSAVIDSAGAVYADDHVYCCAPPSGFQGLSSNPSLPTGSTRYNVSVSLNTAIDACPDYVDFT